jgi:hypothetical protein
LVVPIEKEEPGKCAQIKKEDCHEFFRGNFDVPSHEAKIQVGPLY